MSQALPVRVWDLPTRLCHWLLAACVAGLFATAWLPGLPFVWHVRLGYGVLALLLFRLAWGVVGGYWSRFSTWPRAWAGLADYLRGRPRPEHLVGHSPLGALSAAAMLLALCAQVGTGLVSDDEIGFRGPLNHLVSIEAGLAATRYHAEIGSWLVLALTALHVVAIVFYALARKRNLVPAMLHGDKPAPAGGMGSSRDGPLHRLLGIGLLAASATAVYLLVAGR